MTAPRMARRGDGDSCGHPRRAVHNGPGPPGAVKHPSVLRSKSSLYGALYARDRRVMDLYGGFRPGQLEARTALAVDAAREEATAELEAYVLESVAVAVRAVDEDTAETHASILREFEAAEARANGPPPAPFPPWGGYVLSVSHSKACFVWRFCMGAQGAQHPKTTVSGPGRIGAQAARAAGQRGTAGLVAVRAGDCRRGRLAQRPGRVRSHCRCRNRGTESLSDFGVKWMSGCTKRQCDRTLGRPRGCADRGGPRRGQGEVRLGIYPIASFEEQKRPDLCGNLA